MMRGYVKNVDETRGFGFVCAEDGHDYFFHCRDVAPGTFFSKALVNREVEFDPEVTEKPKDRARNVKTAKVNHERVSHP